MMIMILKYFSFETWIIQKKNQNLSENEHFSTKKRALSMSFHGVFEKTIKCVSEVFQVFVFLVSIVADNYASILFDLLIDAPACSILI